VPHIFAIGDVLDTRQELTPVVGLRCTAAESSWPVARLEAHGLVCVCVR
jgi:hypothetical protein